MSTAAMHDAMTSPAVMLILASGTCAQCSLQWLVRAELSLLTAAMCIAELVTTVVNTAGHDRHQYSAVVASVPYQQSSQWFFSSHSIRGTAPNTAQFRIGHSPNSAVLGFFKILVFLRFLKFRKILEKIQKLKISGIGHSPTAVPVT